MFDRPPTTDVQAVTSGCSYAWDSRQSAWSQSCGEGSTRTTTHDCERSDGSVAADNLCSGTKPAPNTETRTSYDGCKSKEWALTNQIGRAQVCTTVTNAQIVFRLLLEKT